MSTVGVKEFLRPRLTEREAARSKLGSRSRSQYFRIRQGLDRMKKPPSTTMITGCSSVDKNGTTDRAVVEGQEAPLVQYLFGVRSINRSQSVFGEQAVESPHAPKLGAQPAWLAPKEREK